jgi:peptidoglycan/LPS O-acetylase OafA/YrhL
MQCTERATKGGGNETRVETRVGSAFWGVAIIAGVLVTIWDAYSEGAPARIGVGTVAMAGVGVILLLPERRSEYLSWLTGGALTMVLVVVGILVLLSGIDFSAPLTFGGALVIGVCMTIIIIAYLSQRT